MERAIETARKQMKIIRQALKKEADIEDLEKVMDQLVKLDDILIEGQNELDATISEAIEVSIEVQDHFSGV